MKPLTATTHLFVWAGTHRADASGAQNDRDPFARQCNLELVEEKNTKISVVRCGNDVVILQRWVGVAAPSGVVDNVGLQAGSVPKAG